MSKQLDKARAAAKKKNYEYAFELYALHLKLKPDDVEARLELRKSERLHKKLSGGGGWGAAVRQCPRARIPGDRPCGGDPRL